MKAEFNYNEKFLNEKHVLKYVNKEALKKAVDEFTAFIQENINPSFEPCAPDAGKRTMYRKYMECVSLYESVREEEMAAMEEVADAVEEGVAETAPAPTKEKKAKKESKAAKEPKGVGRDPQHRLEVYTAELEAKEAIKEPDAATRKRIASLHRKIKRAQAALQRDAANAARVAATEARKENK